MAGTSVPALARLLAQTQLPNNAGATAARAVDAASRGVPLSPVLILVLCVVAGVGTAMLLPSRREAPVGKIGGAILIAAAAILLAVLVRFAAGTAAGQMNLYFWIFATIGVVGAIRVITHTRPVYSALYFVLTVFATAGLFVLLWAEFMAAALVLIYAGAILVTYVFVIMLAAEAAPASTTGTGAGDGDGDGDAPGGTGALSTLSETDAISREPLAACAVGFALLGVLLFVIFDKAQAVTRDPAPAAAQVATDGPHLEGVQLLGDFLFRRHLLNLELAGLILTVSMVGAIVIARKRVVGEFAPGMGAIAGTSPSGASIGEGDIGETITGPATPVNDDPHSIPVYGTLNPRQKEYPET